MRLNISMGDDNRDGYKDLIFQGKLVLIEGLTGHGDWYNSIKTGDGKSITYSIDNPLGKYHCVSFFSMILLQDILKKKKIM